MAATSRPFESRSGVCVAGRPDEIDQWIVSLEFGRPDHGPQLDFSDFTVLMDRLGDLKPTGVWHRDRYRIGVQVAAPTAFQAVQRAVAWHRHAVRVAGLDSGAPVRVEVHTAQDSEWSWEDDPPASVTGNSAPGRYVSDELMMATRQLVAATTTAEVGDILDRFVIAVGGRVEPRAVRSRAGIVDVDMSVDGGLGHHGVAPSLSVAGLMLEQSLPTLLIDARQTIARLQDGHSSGAWS
jgi:hypothetical protein